MGGGGEKRRVLRGRRWRGWVVEEEIGGGVGGEKIGGGECLGGRWRGWVVEEEMGGGGGGEKIGGGECLGGGDGGDG